MHCLECDCASSRCCIPRVGRGVVLGSPPMAHSSSEGKSQEFPFSPAGFFMLRTPLLPFEELGRWGEGLEAARFQPDTPEFAAALQRDRVTLRARLGVL